MALTDETGSGVVVHIEAVQLFIERALSVSPDLVWTAADWQQIARICCLVDGMPLGIELAATWMSHCVRVSLATGRQKTCNRTRGQGVRWSKRLEKWRMR
jgi:predicted ATPase